mmetsp:Transcript_8856/g.20927  ORF Transcript_8856/g.20927 Transcript_8856/m.20927 type:complete len:258 (+) Transcript_8856:349-1122(+)
MDVELQSRGPKVARSVREGALSPSRWQSPGSNSNPTLPCMYTYHLSRPSRLASIDFAGPRKQILSDDSSASSTSHSRRAAVSSHGYHLNRTSLASCHRKVVFEVEVQRGDVVVVIHPQLLVLLTLILHPILLERLLHVKHDHFLVEVVWQPLPCVTRRVLVVQQVLSLDLLQGVLSANFQRMLVLGQHVDDANLACFARKHPHPVLRLLRLMVLPPREIEVGFEIICGVGWWHMQETSHRRVILFQPRFQVHVPSNV